MLASESEKGSAAGSALAGLRTALDKEKTISAMPWPRSNC